MLISHLDHLVLTVSNIDRSVVFYERVLGMRAETFADGRQALHFGGSGRAVMAQKINLHELGREFEPRAEYAVAGSADLCLVSALPLSEALQHVRDCGVEIIEGPVPRTGAKGPMNSFYFRDPDQNLIEVCHY